MRWFRTPNIDHTMNQLRPRWRGKLHLAGSVLTLPASYHLTLMAKGAAAVFASLVFAASMLAVFSVSAAYHLAARTKRAQRVMRRIDHATIYFLIAGTITPVCLLAVPRAVGIPLLVFAWVAACVGAALKATATADRFAKTLYLAIGWSAVVVLPWLWRTHAVAAILVLVGGVLYTAGAILFAKRAPRLAERTFGYHEVWHAATLCASALHYTAIVQLVR